MTIVRLIRKGPIVISPKNKSVKSFFNKLGKTIEIKKEKISKNFWTTSSFMAPFYYMMEVNSNWLKRRGVNRRSAEDYTRELFLALARDSVYKKNYH